MQYNKKVQIMVNMKMEIYGHIKISK